MRMRVREKGREKIYSLTLAAKLLCIYVTHFVLKLPFGYEFLLVFSATYKTLGAYLSIVCNIYQLFATLHVSGTLENH